MYFKDPILIIAVGGGGDIVASAMLASKLERNGYKVYVSCFPWERFIIDPVPGPIPLKDIYNYKFRGGYFRIIDHNSYALRDGSKVVFQAVNVSRALMKDIILFDLSGGADSLYRGICEVVSRYNIEMVIGLDVGGDILAYGGEDELWSPLADQLSLAALYRVTYSILNNTYIAVAGLGGDGELSLDTLRNRINALKNTNGYFNIELDKHDKEILGIILKHAYTEASRSIYHSLDGYIGVMRIRYGTRIVYIDRDQSITHFIPCTKIYKLSRMARRLLYTRSIEEANMTLLNMGYPTEYELEKTLYKYISLGYNVSPRLIIRSRNEVKNRVAKLII